MTQTNSSIEITMTLDQAKSLYKLAVAENDESIIRLLTRQFGAALANICAVPVSEEVKGSLQTLERLIQLRDCYRQGWVPPMEVGEDEEGYYLIGLRTNEDDTVDVMILHNTEEGDRMLPLSFQTYDQAEVFANTYRPLIMDLVNLR